MRVKLRVTLRVLLIVIFGVILEVILIDHKFGPISEGVRCDVIAFGSVDTEQCLAISKTKVAVIN